LKQFAELDSYPHGWMRDYSRAERRCGQSMTKAEASPIPNVARGAAPRSPSLLQIAWQIRNKGALQFFMDEWRAQGDLPHLRMGRHKLLFVIHPEHVRRVLVTGRQDFDKLQTWESSRQLLLGDGLIASTGELWKRQRRLLSSLFTPRNIEQYYPVMLAETEATARRWESFAQSERPIDVLDEMTRVTACIILRSMFGMDISEQRLRSLEGDVETMILFVNNREMLPVKPPLWAPLPSHRRYLEARSRVHALIREVIARRRAEPQASWPNDLLSKLMLARDEKTGESMTDLLVHDESLGIFVAGHETTARTMAFLWYALHDNPSVAARLHAELDAVLPADQPPTLEQLKRLPYTMQTIQEVLRLYPPSPAQPRDARVDQALGELRVQPGTYLLLFPYATHRHPEFWEEPERFDPDRFLPSREQARHPFAYYPFGGGQRICLGNSFAMLEALILTALLARRFSARLVAGHQPRIEMAGTLMIRNGLPMRISSRLSD
jgi:cytochrome P450